MLQPGCASTGPSAVIRLVSALMLAASPTLAADLHGGAPTGRFLATCEDLGRICFADACGGNQIEAALNCRAACPSSVVLRVVPKSCPLPPPETRVRVTVRRKG